MSFELIPAIDLLDGACVRLAQGRYDAATVYERDPAAVVERFVQHPIGRIHVVDLDGAKAGRPRNRDAVLRIVERAGCVPVQLGGGIRTRFPGRIVVGVDARDGRVAVEGWLDESEASAVEVARRFEDAGVAALVYTDIGRDGMLSGPNFEATAALAKAVEIPVILSGGVSSPDDLVRAASCADGRLAGAIVGRALYTGAVELGAALERLEKLAC
jgi:phosphoribosylformimino-5-aminoimidazole carboxamide ribotide isomerase